MRPEDLVRALAEAFNAGDVERMEALFTDDPEVIGLRAALEGTRYVGSDAVRRFWADAMEIWSELRVDMEETRVEGDTVVGRAGFRARGRKSGAEINQRIAVRFRIEAGRIASFRTFLDPAEAD